MRRRFAPTLALLALLAFPASALGAAANPDPKGKQAPEATQVPDATVKIKLGKLKQGRAQIYSEVPVIGTLRPFVPGQKVLVEFFRDGKPLVARNVKVSKAKGNWGEFRTSVFVREDGVYAASARHEANDELGGDSTVRKKWRVSFPGLSRGDCGDVVVGFKRAMREMGYIANAGKCFGGKTARGVLAYRKVNGMERSFRAGPGLVEDVFAGKGEYKVRYPNAGTHVEAPLDKQVIAFIKKGKPVAVYPVSSGTSATPTVRGRFEFFRNEPGYNNLGMYYSFYFYGGYAIHGYKSVPNYPASHGCLRTFIADQPEIYDRIQFGETIFVW